ncbi:uncharacterized protein VNE69_01157 [Vairimorpha necatrix]|uniref:Uncharacterized protein n=1 Tax=Vairimorpha necatrix TaxID=6039 RepID=A0AAX4J8J9_9MICR
MLKSFMKKTRIKPKDFKFCKSGYKLSAETLKEYKYIKKLFFITANIFSSYIKGNGIDEIKDLILFYEKSDTLLCSLIDEIFTKRFIDSLDRRYALFVLLDKLLRFFYIFDIQRYKNVNIFNNFSNFKLRNNLSEKDNLKLSTFSSIAMPMGRLFMSYFTSEDYELFHPIILKKRSTLFIGDTKMEYLKYVCSILSYQTDLKYLKMFMFSLYERLSKKNKFDNFYDKLNTKEKEYYIDLIEII